MFMSNIDTMDLVALEDRNGLLLNLEEWSRLVTELSEKEVASFLKRNGWDLKYSTSQTKLRGQKQIDYLFEEMEKEKEL